MIDDVARDIVRFIELFYKDGEVPQKSSVTVKEETAFGSKGEC